MALLTGAAVAGGVALAATPVGRRVAGKAFRRTRSAVRRFKKSTPERSLRAHMQRDTRSFITSTRKFRDNPNNAFIDRVLIPTPVTRKSLLVRLRNSRGETGNAVDEYFKTYGK